MIIYKFTTWKWWGEKSPLFEVEEIEVEEKPKSYVNNKYHSRINKKEINELNTSYGYQMYCLDNNPETFINAVIENKTKKVERLEMELQNEKNALEKWKERGENG